MELSINPERKHYKPVLVVVFGSGNDDYSTDRLKEIKKTIKTPIKLALYVGGRIDQAYNESIRFCLQNKIRYAIFVRKDIYPSGDWSLMLRKPDYKTHSIIYFEKTFVIVNVAKTVRYGLYQTVKDFDDLLNWLIEKSKSEGHKYRRVNDDEIQSIETFGIEREEPFTYSKTKKKKSKKENKWIKNAGADAAKLEKESEEVPEPEEEIIIETPEEEENLFDGEDTIDDTN